MPEPYTSDSSDSRGGSVSFCRPPFPTSFETGAEGSHRTACRVVRVEEPSDRRY